MAKSDLVLDSESFDTWHGTETIGVARPGADLFEIPTGIWAQGDRIWMTSWTSGYGVRLATDDGAQDGSEAAAYFVRRLRSLVAECLGRGAVASRASSLLEASDDDGELLRRAVERANASGKILGEWVADLVRRELDRDEPSPASAPSIAVDDAVQILRDFEGFVSCSCSECRATVGCMGTNYSATLDALVEHFRAEAATGRTVRLEVIVNGNERAIEVATDATFGEVKAKALVEDRSTHLPPSAWEVRDAAGHRIADEFRVNAFPDRGRFWITRPVGYGG